jgi:exodeoxyribonuclease V gamma subunit
MEGKGNSIEGDRGMKVFMGNRLEVLVDRLCAHLSQPLSSPLLPEIIVVQSRGMDRWLSMEIAVRQGICTNIRFPFPKNFIAEIFKRIIPDYQEPAVFQTEVMPWMIMKLLPGFLDDQDFEEIKRYLAMPDGRHGSSRSDADHNVHAYSLKLYQLSSRIAGVFDRYMIHRPQMIDLWDEGGIGTPEEIWQARLWKAISEAGHGKHLSNCYRELCQKLQEVSARPGSLPERLSLFCTSYMPAFYVRIFHELARYIPVYFFLLNPSREYWGDIRSERETGKALRKIRGETGQISLTDKDLYFEEGNPLLASMGATGRAFVHYVIGIQNEVEECFENPGRQTLLNSIQSNILTLSGKPSNGGARAPLAPMDRSIEIHICHSPMREVEVLHQKILSLLEEDLTLLPRDILVMTPDVETYAPFIQSVFNPFSKTDGAMDGTHAIPYSISDQGISLEYPSVRALFSIMDLRGSRLSASEVLSVIELDPVRRRFGLSEEDLDLVRHWISETRICWGFDAGHREALSLPAMEENTWTKGFERLLMGFALPGHGERMFEGILPYDDIESGEALILGRFMTFMDRLYEAVSNLSYAGNVDDWVDRLMALCRTFIFDEDYGDMETVEQDHVIMDALKQMRDIAISLQFDVPLDLDVVRSFLSNNFRSKFADSGFMTGGVTFCTLLPMRSVPFRVVYLMGMNDSAYPRQDRPCSFDLLAQHPRSGDPSQREEDRYLFLEALLSARDRFIISYIGRSIDDNHIIPPSVLVSELLDYLDSAYTCNLNQKASEQITTIHHLQAFHPDYFRPVGKWFSYDADNCLAAQCLQGPCCAPQSFLADMLEDPPEEFRTVDLAELRMFFHNPVRYLLKKRLRINLDEKPILPDDEVFVMEGLTRYMANQSLVQEISRSRVPGQTFAVLKASGRLPHGTVGETAYRDLYREAKEFVDVLSTHRTGKPLDPFHFRLPVGPFTLTGFLDGLYTTSMITYRYALLNARDHLDLWLAHLAASVVHRQGYPVESLLIGKDKSWRIRPVDQPDSILGELLSIYWSGMKKDVHFFSQSAWVYVELLRKKTPAQQALNRAAWNWIGYKNLKGECNDRYYTLCYSGDNPLDSTFEDLARRILEPLLNHEEAV